MNSAILEKYIDRFRQSGERTKKSMWNIVLSFVAKGLSIVLSLLIVPLTIDYVNPTRYGIWLTLSSIISWIGFFDLGLGNGMRNRFAEAKANNDDLLARQYISTTYFAIMGIMAVVMVALLIANQFIDWPAVLSVGQEYSLELRKVFGILVTFFCFNIVFILLTTVLTADQKIGISSLITVLGQLLSLIAIWLLTKYTEGNLINLASYYAGIPTITLLVCSIIAYSMTSYNRYAPTLKEVRKNLVNDILKLGVQFFVICISLIFVFQLINIVISRELGPETVTEYNVAYKYFSVLQAVISIISTPFWSAFTDAYQREDFEWMRKSKNTLEKVWLLSVGGAFVMLLCSGIFYQLWIGDKVSIRFSLSVCVAIYTIVHCLTTIYMQLINGIGAIRLQLIIYSIGAVISYPLMVLSCRHIGIEGVMISPFLVLVAQAVVIHIQLNKILSRTATGIWIK